MAKRTTVTFDDYDQGVIASVSNPDQAEWAVLVVLVEAAAEKGIGLKPGASEAAIIRALVRVGADALRERALERGYAELADLWPDVHDDAESRERRRRYAHRVDRVADA